MEGIENKGPYLMFTIYLFYRFHCVAVDTVAMKEILVTARSSTSSSQYCIFFLFFLGGGGGGGGEGDMQKPLEQARFRQEAQILFILHFGLSRGHF